MRIFLQMPQIRSADLAEPEEPLVEFGMRPDTALKRMCVPTIASHDYVASVNAPLPQVLHRVERDSVSLLWLQCAHAQEKRCASGAKLRDLLRRRLIDLGLEISPEMLPAYLHFRIDRLFVGNHKGQKFFGGAFRHGDQGVALEHDLIKPNRDIPNMSG